MRAFYERVRARRGAQVAAVATARKLASLFWCLLTREQDYAFGQPSLTRQQDPPARARRRRAVAQGPGPPGRRRRATSSIRDAERALALTGRGRLPPHDRRLEGHPATEGGRERDTGARITKALEGQSRAADHKPLTSALRYVNRSHPTTRSHTSRQPTSPLDFHPSVVHVVRPRMAESLKIMRFRPGMPRSRDVRSLRIFIAVCGNGGRLRPKFDLRCAGKIRGAELELGTNPLGRHTRSSEEAGTSSAATPTTACRPLREAALAGR